MFIREERWIVLEGKKEEGRRRGKGCPPKRERRRSLEGPFPLPPSSFCPGMQSDAAAAAIYGN